MAAAAALNMASGSALAQTAPTGTLRVTVVDPSGAVIVGATVTVSGDQDERAKAWYRVVDSDVMDLVRAGDIEGARTRATELLLGKDM